MFSTMATEIDMMQYLRVNYYYNFFIFYHIIFILLWKTRLNVFNKKIIYYNYWIIFENCTKFGILNNLKQFAIKFNRFTIKQFIQK